MDPAVRPALHHHDQSFFFDSFGIFDLLQVRSHLNHNCCILTNAPFRKVRVEVVVVHEVFSENPDCTSVAELVINLPVLGANDAVHFEQWATRQVRNEAALRDPWLGAAVIFSDRNVSEALYDADLHVGEVVMKRVEHGLNRTDTLERYDVVYLPAVAATLFYEARRVRERTCVVYKATPFFQVELRRV